MWSIILTPSQPQCKTKLLGGRAVRNVRAKKKKKKKSVPSREETDHQINLKVSEKSRRTSAVTTDFTALIADGRFCLRGRSGGLTGAHPAAAAPFPRDTFHRSPRFDIRE